MGVQNLFKSLLSVLLGINQKWTAGSYGNCRFNFFEEPTILFSIAAAQFYIPTHSAQGSHFLHIFANHFLFIAVPVGMK